MYDPSEIVYNGKLGIVVRWCSRDYHHGTPIGERLNPLRLSIGIGPRRPAWFTVNKRGRAAVWWSNLLWRLRNAR